MTPEQRKLADELISSGARQAAEALHSGITSMRSWRDKPLSDEMLDLAPVPFMNSVSLRLWHLLDTDLLFNPNREQKWVIVFSKLDAEVQNGGFHQYFWNTEGATLGELNSGLAYVEDAGLLNTLSSASERAARYNYSRSWLAKTWKCWFWRSFQKGYEEKRFDDVDDIYSGMSPSAIELVAGWAKKNFNKIKEGA